MDALSAIALAKALADLAGQVAPLIFAGRSTATAEQQAQIDADLARYDAARISSWAEADAALQAASQPQP